MTTIRALLSEANRCLAAAGVPSAIRDARLLMEFACGVPIATQIGNANGEVDPAAAERFCDLVDRRARREPMAQILGRREFWSLEFKVTRHTLDPRPDSETLVQVVLDRLQDRAAHLNILDFGTGTGCLLLSLLHELPNAVGVGIDISTDALEVAVENARNLGLSGRAEFRLQSWEDGTQGQFQVVISNPPYVPSGVIPTLQPEVARFEPRLALDGGADGLDAYRRLLPVSERLLSAGGLAAFEVGIQQADSVAAIGASCGLQHLATAPDLGGVPRIVLWQKEQPVQRIEQ